MLSVENAGYLLDELERVLPRLTDGKRNEELVESTERLLESLGDLPGPPELLRDPVEELRAWTRVLLEGGGRGRHPGPGGPADVAERQIFRLRELLEREKGFGA